MDDNNVEWTFGYPKVNPKVNQHHLKDSVIIWLPISMKSMYPVIQNIDIYCSCIKCNHNIDYGIICIEFQKLSWGIRLICKSCLKEQDNIVECNDKLIVNVASMISSKLDYGCSIGSKHCLVCEKPHCIDMDCKNSLDKLYKNDIEILLEHFYRIKLDILHVFVKDNLCNYCKEYIGSNNICCNKCKLRIYCSKKCKKLDSKHTCKDYYEIWRNIVLF